MEFLFTKNKLNVLKRGLIFLLGGPIFFLLLIYCTLLSCRYLFCRLLLSSRKPIASSFPRQIVFVTYAPWRGVFDRHLQISHKLSRSYPVLYCQLISISTLICHPGSFNELGYRSISERINYLGILILPLDGRVKILSRFNRFIISIFIKDVLSQIHFDDFVLWLWEPHRHYLIGELGERFSIYDVIDEYSELLGPADVILEQEKEMFAKVDLVFCGTDSLFQARKDKHSHIYFIPGGVDYQLFANVDTNKMPKELKDIIKHPLIGFYGMLDQRVDVELLKALATEHPEWNILLIGPEKADFSSLKNSPNIHFLGKKDYEQLPYYLHNFDVAIIPYKINKLTRYINPNKMLELFAGGKPVVSTPILDVEKFYDDIAYIGRDKKRFIKGVEQALKQKDSNRIEKGRGIARENSWEAIIERIDSLIKERAEEIVSLK